ncbi:MAG: hypothetical protein EOO40_10085 [Deltaproteobacteria bacterium]|nr:MAG: hypothetical protein EOO40_10085 [Deltaproteobacteria bacterium]
MVLTSGKDYSPAAPSLLMLAPQFPLTYLATFGALHLILLNRIYTVIKINLAALIISPFLNAPLIMLGQHWGPGWAGGLAAFASICTEGANAAISFYILGAAAVDRRFWAIMGKTAAICALVTGLHVLLPSWQAWRIPLEVALYLLLAVLLNALPVGDIRRMAMEAVNSRRGKKAT